MDYLGLFTPYHIANLHDWIVETGELFVDLNYPHAGNGPDYFVRSLEDLRRLVIDQAQWPEIEIVEFVAKVFVRRGAR